MAFYLIEDTVLDNILNLAEDDGAEKATVANLQQSLATAQTQEGAPLPSDVQARIAALTAPPDANAGAGTATLNPGSGTPSDNIAGGDGTGEAPPAEPGTGERSVQPGSPAANADAPAAGADASGGPTNSPAPAGTPGQPASGM